MRPSLAHVQPSLSLRDCSTRSRAPPCSQAVRQTLKAQPRDAQTEAVRVGVEGKDFRFEHVPHRFYWTTCSAAQGDTKDLEALVRRFIR